MATTAQNSAKAAMLIRRPVAEVFEAFINPEITTKIWFTKSSSPLEEGRLLEWGWEMYDVAVPVFVREIVPLKRIEIEWGNQGQKTIVTWTFTATDEEKTFVSIINSGFNGDPAQLLASVRDATEGFTLVLASLKALLEHAIQLNLVGDRFPKEIK